MKHYNLTLGQKIFITVMLPIVFPIVGVWEACSEFGAAAGWWWMRMRHNWADYRRMMQ